MSRKGNNIYHRKDGRWEGRFVKGRSQSRTVFGYVYGKTYQEALNKQLCAAREWKVQLRAQSKNRSDLCTVSVEWMKGVKACSKESTAVKYEQCLRSYIRPVLGKMDMSRITNEMISSFCDNLLERGGKRAAGLSPSTVSCVLFILKQLRKFALKHDITVGFSNDCVSVKLRQKPIRVFSLQEQKLLQDYLLKNPSLKHLGILLCLFTGLRLGEICALRWDDISLIEKQILVSNTVQRIQNLSKKGRTLLYFAKPKSPTSNRIIPLTDQVCALIASEYKAGAYFLTGTKERCMDPRTMQKCFAAVLAKCGIRHANFHVLRHTFATRWADAGLDLKCLSALLGHSTANITLNRYVHPSMESKRKGLRRMEEFLEAVK